MTDLTFKVSRLTKSFGNNQVLKSIDLDIKKDKSLVILGGSGSGKSVLIKSIVGLIEPDSGSILYNGVESVKMPEKQRFEMMQQCGYLFQSGALFDSLTVQQNITFFAEKISNLTKKNIRDLATQKLLDVGLDAKVLDLYPAELSGGMQKRVSLARTVCTNPKIIFFDEPTTGLDPIMSNVINDLIIKLRDQLGATTITITHDMHSARRIGTEVAYLSRGYITWYSPMSELDKTDNQELKSFILGGEVA
jgi:phospholipid/cholesterol/gamma-HCH transport system ATP-binding protein